MAAKECTIRREPGGEYRLLALDKWMEVRVYELGDEWSLVSCGEAKGWVLTRCLGCYRSLDPFAYPVPGARIMDGILTFHQDVTVSGGKMKDITAPSGAVLCVTEGENGAYEMPVWRGQGRLQMDSGAFTAFIPWDEAEPGDLIGGFTTYYDGTLGRPLTKERVFNIDLCSQRINGSVTAPGETFSFNALAGRYYRDGGYQLAVNVSKSGRGYGGGVCQVTTTLCNALLGVPLRIDKWTVHQMSGVDYIPQFFDAAVGNHQDFTFVNTLPYPVRLWAADQNGCVTVLIYRAEDRAGA